MAKSSAAAPVSVVVARVMVKAPVAPVSDKGPVRIAAGQVRVADPAAALLRVGVGEVRITTMAPVLTVALGPVRAPALWALVMVRAIQAMANPDTAKPMEYGA